MNISAENLAFLLSSLALLVTGIDYINSLKFRKKDELDNRPYIDVHLDIIVVDGAHEFIDGTWMFKYSIDKIIITNYGKGTALDFELRTYRSRNRDLLDKDVIEKKGDLMSVLMMRKKYILSSNFPNKPDMYSVDRDSQIGYFGEWHDDGSYSYLYSIISFYYKGNRLPDQVIRHFYTNEDMSSPWMIMKDLN